MAELTNLDRFVTELTTQYTALQTDPAYAMAFAKFTPASLAVRMTNGLLSGSASKDGDGVKRACKVLGVRHTYKGIHAFLSGRAA